MKLCHFHKLRVRETKSIFDLILSFEATSYWQRVSEVWGNCVTWFVGIITKATNAVFTSLELLLMFALFVHIPWK